MRCPFCGHLENRVVDSRQASDGVAIRRRRECRDCDRRFTTYERVEEVFPRIIKNDDRREDYDRRKVVRGIQLAASKRPISTSAIDELVDRVERKMLEAGRREIKSAWLGKAISQELRNLDPVAYIRFASVYRGFSDIDEFIRELQQFHTAQPADEPVQD